MKDVIQKVTDRVVKRSVKSRAGYLAQIDANFREGPRRKFLSEGNLAHASAACPLHEKNGVLEARWANLGIVTAFNDMLSAHQPFENYPPLIKHAARRNGATAQVAGGTPAMCDGVTQGKDGMELSLLSRDTIAMSTAVALSHDMFDASILLGVCDKIVPGLLIGALRYGHLPAIFAPAGPMPSGIPNPEKARIRQQFALGEIGREELLKAESASYHAPGTCTFYGTANSNQMLLELMGLQLPGTSFVQPNTPLRDALTAQTTRRAIQITHLGDEYTPIGKVIDEKAIINGLVGLMATGGSTNVAIHIVAIARAAGILINWDDFAEISAAVPLICRVYPNGAADVNHFHAAGGMAYLVGQLIDEGLVHKDVTTVAGGDGLLEYTREPIRNAHAEADYVLFRNGPKESLDKEILTDFDNAFRPDGGLRLLTGNLGRSMMKVSAVKRDNWLVEAPAIVVDHQDELKTLHQAGKLEKDFIVVLRFQGPKANGMPELHALTPIFGAQMDKGFKVGLITDGRLSGASGKFPAAIHAVPEALDGGPLSQILDGDTIRIDPLSNTAVVVGVDLSKRQKAKPKPRALSALTGMGMYAPMRAASRNAEEGASFLGEPEWMNT